MPLSVSAMADSSAAACDSRPPTGTFSDNISFMNAQTEAVSIFQFIGSLEAAVLTGKLEVEGSLEGTGVGIIPSGVRSTYLRYSYGGNKRE